MLHNSDEMKITRLNDTTFFADLDETEKWLASRGFQRDRLCVYKANIEEMIQWERGAHPAQVFADVEAAGRTTEILTSYVEGIELVDALTCLRSKQIEIPNALLRIVLDGPPDAAQEDYKSNQARNAMFELLMGAMAARSDLRPILGQANPDVEFQFQDRRVLMECKRVMSAKSVVDNISGAIHQLAKRVDSGKTEIGLVAICISRLIQQGNGYWDVDVPSPKVPYDRLSLFLQAIITGLDHHLQALQQPSVSGIVFYVSSPFRVQNIGYTPVKQGMLYPMNPADTDFLRGLEGALEL
jgi:hypothetical protein